MAISGDSYTITLKQAHLNWGTHRYTSSRGIVYGEGYIPIPSQYAHRFNIYNSNYDQQGLGFNIFNCNSYDGFLQDVSLKSGGSSTSGDIYAKQFHGNGNLQTLGAWFARVNAQVGDSVEVTWTSPTDIVIRLI